MKKNEEIIEELLNHPQMNYLYTAIGFKKLDYEGPLFKDDLLKALEEKDKECLDKILEIQESYECSG